MNDNFEIRWCREGEINWVNDQYEKIDFKPSRLDTDRIAIAFSNKEAVGLGRLCKVERLVFELGGMFVQPAYQGQGIARKIVRFLLKERGEGRVYCLPFAHLRNFYEGEGFEEVSKEEFSNVPPQILEKYRWCNTTYSHDVLLLRL